MVLLDMIMHIILLKQAMADNFSMDSSTLQPLKVRVAHSGTGLESFGVIK